MHQRPRFVVLTSVLVGMFMLLPGCATRREASSGGLARMPGESVVLIGTQPAQLAFTHPRTGQVMEFAAPWPEDFAAAVQALSGA